MLRCCIQRQNEWEKWLPFVEIAINNSASSTTGQSPYFANYGFHPQFKGVRQIEERESNVPTAAQFVNEIQENIKEMKVRMQGAIDRQKLHADKKQRELIFQEGDLVKLNTRNLPIILGVRKLTDRFSRPFKIEKKISNSAYKLKLPSTYKIHPVFHVSQLEPVKVSQLFPREEEKAAPPVVPAENNSSDEWEIEKILGERKRYRRKEYLIKWKGYPPEENSWVPEYNLTNAQEVLDEFYNSQRQQLARAVVTDRVSESLQCKALTKGGTRCKRRTRRGEYCWAHSERELNLRIRTSSIPQAGLGAFAGKKPIEKDCRYWNLKGKSNH